MRHSELLATGRQVIKAQVAETEFDALDVTARSATEGSFAAPSASEPPMAPSGDALAAARSYVLDPNTSKGRPKKAFADTLYTGEQRLLNVREAARWLGLSKSTLDKMRCAGCGPRFVQVTRRAIRYAPADLADFANSRRRCSTLREAIESLRG